MRVNPIFDWSYHEVWAFLRLTGADYCSLYDHGFTSLGGRFNTHPNRQEQQGVGSSPAVALLLQAAIG
jgi:FAD synthetase